MSASRRSGHSPIGRHGISVCNRLGGHSLGPMLQPSGTVDHGVEKLATDLRVDPTYRAGYDAICNHIREATVTADSCGRSSGGGTLGMTRLDPKADSQYQRPIR
jgi:hypothetical protein